jgi:hypothetical protein
MPAEINIGDIVRHHNPQGLHCSTQIYGGAVVTSVEPLILVSDSGDMMWHTIKAADVHAVGRAPIYAWANALSRMEREGMPLPHIAGTEEAVKRAQLIVLSLEELAVKQRELREELLGLGDVPAGVSASAPSESAPQQRSA